MEIEPRRKGTNPLIETKAEAELKVPKHKRYYQIMEILNDFEKPMSAKEIAVEMHRRGYTPSEERNYAAPRITEMLKNGWLDCIGTKVCSYSNVRVGVYVIRCVNEV